MRIKPLLLTALGAVLACGVMPVSTQAQTGSGSTQAMLDSVANAAGIDVGFIGHPFLKRNGYKAENGALAIQVGQIGNLDHLTDNNPASYAAATGLAGVSLVMSEWMKVVPDPEQPDKHKYYPAGTKVGFMLGSNNSALSVVDLGVIDMTLIYFYKDGAQVGTQHLRNAGTSSLIDLNLVHVDMQDTPQKVECEADYEFDGVGIGFGGISADVGNQLRVYYAYVDDWVEVPIIRKYYMNATSECAGMVTGAKNLINNDLEDGATTAVLNIGGAYYTVMAGKELPAGAEIGFVMSGGHLLDLGVGSVVELRTLDADGNVKEVSTRVNAVSLNLAGGGMTKVSMMTTEPCWGVKLDRIVGLELDLGATVVHYAYIRLPQMPTPDMPLMVDLDIIPHCTANKYGGVQNLNAKYSNTHNNVILLHNDPTLPVLTENHNSSYWPRMNVGNGWNTNPTLRLAVGRHDGDAYPTNDDIDGFIYLIHYTGTSGLQAKNGHYYWQYKGKGNTWMNHRNDWGEIALKGDTLDLSSIVIQDREKVVDFSKGQTGSDYYTYALYLAPDAHDKDDIENAVRLTADGVAVPRLSMRYEMAGRLDEITSGDNATPTYNVGEYGNYLVVNIPQTIGTRSRVLNFTLCDDDHYVKDRPMAKYERNADGAWVGTGNAANPLAQNTVGNIDIVVLARENSTGVKRHLLAETELVDTYVAELKTRYPAATIDDLADNSNYSRMYNNANVEAPTREVPAMACTSATYLRDPNIDPDISLFEYTIYYNDAAEQIKQATEPSESDDSPRTRAVAGGPADTHYWPVMTQWCAAFQNSTVGAWSDTQIESTDTKSLAAASSLTTLRDASQCDHADAEVSLDNANNQATAKLQGPGGTKNYVNPVVMASYTRAYLPLKVNGVPNMAPSYIVVDNTKNYKVTSSNTVTGVENIAADSLDEAQPVLWYDLQGRQVAEPASGLYIRRQGATTTKVIF